MTRDDHRRASQRRVRLLALSTLAMTAVTACAQQAPTAGDVRPVELGASQDRLGIRVPPAGEPAEEAPAGDLPTATLAFAGDVHFEGSSRAALDGPVGDAFDVLAAADVAVVNLETAVTESGSPAGKQYTFRAPQQALTRLADAGVDAASLANNHGIDFGRQGLRDTLAAETATGFPLIGAGSDIDEAFEPLRATVNDIDISVIAATDVLDGFALDRWPATDDRPGMASSKGAGIERLMQTVEQEVETADVVAVMLHWGVEQQVCPSERQTELAERLTGAGVDVLVGSHAHVLQPATVIGGGYVNYGLGNFLWYSRGGAGAVSGVAEVTVTADGYSKSQWHPATISGGIPTLAQGPDRDQMIADLPAPC